jgi:hypothetical protein
VSLIPESKLDFWIQNNLNVILRGKHGAGKTASILSSFKKHGLKYKYFSAATMDPWVDFVGVPKESTDENGNLYLGFIRPKEFQDDEVEAIFFDEFNRAKAPVRNAVMELLQFKSINGKKLNNLRFVWAAINPEKDENEEDESQLEYDVEKLDPAQLDRFHVIYDVPYTPDKTYFFEKYGSTQGAAALEWWNALPAKIKDRISPRRLDYALTMNELGGDIADVLDKESNPSKLSMLLQLGSVASNLKKIIETNDTDQAERLFSNINFVKSAFPILKKNANYLDFFWKFIHAEVKSDAISTDPAILFQLNLDDSELQKTSDIVNSILASGNKLKSKKNTDLKQWLKSSGTAAFSGLSIKDLANDAANNTYTRRKVMATLTDYFYTFDLDQPKAKEIIHNEIIDILRIIGKVITSTQNGYLLSHTSTYADYKKLIDNMNNVCISANIQIDLKATVESAKTLAAKSYPETAGIANSIDWNKFIGIVNQMLP